MSDQAVNKAKQRKIAEKFDIIVAAIRANNLCKKQRQNFSVLRATPLGKHIQPQLLLQPASEMINCFQAIYNDPFQKEARLQAVRCLQMNRDCDEQIQVYRNLK